MVMGEEGDFLPFFLPKLPRSTEIKADVQGIVYVGSIEET